MATEEKATNREVIDLTKDGLALMLNDIRICMVTQTYLELLDTARRGRIIQPQNFQKDLLNLIDAFRASISIEIDG